MRTLVYTLLAGGLLILASCDSTSIQGDGSERDGAGQVKVGVPF